MAFLYQIFLQRKLICKYLLLSNDHAKVDANTFDSRFWYSYLVYLTKDLHCLRKVGTARCGLKIRNQNALYFKIISVNNCHLLGIFVTKYMNFRKFYLVVIR